jgi:hypothetical protein
MSPQNVYAASINAASINAASIKSQMSGIK